MITFCSDVGGGGDRWDGRKGAEMDEEECGRAGGCIVSSGVAYFPKKNLPIR